MRSDSQHHLNALRSKSPFVYSLVKSVYIWLIQLPAFLKWQKLLKQQSIRLELGSGRKRGSSGWTTVDLYGADINWNLKKGLPLPDGSVDCIYSSHMLEHIPYQHIKQFVNECARTLKPGGSFSVCVPNAGLYLKAYSEGRVFLPDHPKFLPAVVDTGSYIDQVNYIAYMAGEHCNMFDDESLLKILADCDFSSVAQRPFDPLIDRKDRDFESIYAIAWR